MRNRSYCLASVLLLGALGVSEGNAKEKHLKADITKKNSAKQDQIVVEGHIPVVGGPVLRFIPTPHEGRQYVYAERAAGKGITLIDVTHPNHPTVVSDLAYATGTGAGTLLAATGSAALACDPSPSNDPVPTQTMRLMDFSDPANPKITKQFEGVTAFEKIPGTGLILLANPEGIWVLSQRSPEDSEMEKRYAKKVIYGDSMY